MTRLTKQKEKLDTLLSGVNAFNAKARAGEIITFLDSYIPAVEKMETQMKKYRGAFKKPTSENQQLTRALKCAADESVLKSSRTPSWNETTRRPLRFWCEFHRKA